MTPLEKVLYRVPDAEDAGRRFSARCPAHHDGRPSLFITEYDDGTVVVNCDGGCRTDRLLSNLGLTVADLFPPFPRQSSPGSEPTKAPADATVDAPGDVFAKSATVFPQPLASLPMVPMDRLEDRGSGEDVADRMARSGERLYGLGVTR